MSLYLRIAWRNVWRQRRRTLLIAGAMGVIMALLVFYDGLLVGMEQAVYGNAIEVMGGNIQIHAPGYGEKNNSNPLLPLENPDSFIQAAEALPNVTRATKRIVTSGMVTNREGAFSITIVGLEPEKEAQFSTVAQNISAGRFLNPDDGDLIVIGQGLANVMDIGLDHRITLVGNTKHEQTRQRTMTVVGIYDIGVPSLEKNTIYMSLNEAQQLFDLKGQITEIVVSLDQIGQEPRVVRALHASRPGYEIDTWIANYPEIKRGLDIDKVVMAVFGAIMLGIAAIGIFNLLMMAVFERTREIGVMGALGLKPRQVTLLFLLEGVLVGVAGAVLGAILGTLINSLVGYYGIDYSMYTDMADWMALVPERIYTQLVPFKVLQHAFTVTIIASIAAIFPAIQASRQEPAEALHYV